MTRRSLVLVLLVGCQVNVELPKTTTTTSPPLEDTAAPPDSEPPVPETGDSGASDPSCDFGTFDEAGGVLAIGGAVLEIPADAWSTPTQVELCLVADTVGAVSDVVEVRPAELEVAVPLTIRLDHSGDEGTTVLLTPNPDGDPARQLQAVAAGMTTLEGPMYRAGVAYAAADARTLLPFETGTGALADLLFVVDNSASMLDEQAKLAASFSALYDALVLSGLDYHVAVTSTDIDNVYPGASGTLVEANGVTWIEPATIDPEDTFAQMVQLGDSGSSAEKGLGGAFLALDGAADPGFVRVEAQIAVVVLSDEPDFTPTSVVSEGEFMDWFEDMKADPDHARFYGIVDPQLGQTYVDVSTTVGGDIADIDSANWEPLLERVVDDFELALGMTLDPPAVDGTIEVWLVPVDGSEPTQIDPALVTFDPATQNLVVPGTEVPDPDVASVVVLYTAK